MTRKSKVFLGLACLALFFSLARSWLGSDIANFSAGLAAALMFGVLINWKRQKA